MDIAVRRVNSVDKISMPPFSYVQRIPETELLNT